MTERLPLIFDIRRFALDDGPGIRTTVFLKGCPLSCVWCHNPEAMAAGRELACYPDRCVRCSACVAACPEHAIAVDAVPQVNRGRCTVCGSCAEVCPSLVLRMVGMEYPLAELLETVMRDWQFFAASGGGVTFSGGEPTLWPEYLGAALQALKGEGVHTAVQTCGLFDYERFVREILPFVDLVMFDLKLIDPAEHRHYTGRDNTVILENFRRLTGEAGDRLLPRVPLVPGISATEGNLLGIASFLAELEHTRCSLLPYNPAGIGKRRAIGMELPAAIPGLPLPAGEEERLRELFHGRLAQKIDTAA